MINLKTNASESSKALFFVGAARFELATSWSQTRRDDRATLRPEKSDSFCLVKPTMLTHPTFAMALVGAGGEGGIRTLGTSLSSYNGLANRPFRPLRHLSERPSARFAKGEAKIKINWVLPKWGVFFIIRDAPLSSLRHPKNKTHLFRWVAILE